MDARLTRVCLFSVIAVAALTLAFGAARDSGEHLTGATERPASRAVVALEINGAIGPATSRYVVHGIEGAKESGASLVVLQMDTPGGLDTSMRDIIRAILASPIPVVTYVAPSGARAASAGTYILYASHVAAMAPATNLGAATPVSIGGEPTPPPTPTSAPTPTPSAAPAPTPTQPPTPPRTGKAQPQRADHSTADEHPTTPDEHPTRPESPARTESPQPATALERKAVNDAVAYIRGLAELRGRNADWAEQAVRGAASLPATAALKEKVIDLIAPDLSNLLTQLDGREVKVADRTVTLSTRNAAVVWNKPDWRTELLAVITNPTIAYGLLLIGIYGLLLEGYNPGALLPGVVGIISLVLALFALQILSVNYAGLALVVLGIGMIVAEFHVHSFGSLGLGGLIAFVIGSLILFDTDVPGMAIGLPLIGGVATVGGLLLIAIVWLAARSRSHRIVTGVQGMVGQTAETMGGFTGNGIVRYGGELWKAHSDLPLQAGQAVRITKVEGLTVWVEPL